MPDIIKYKCKTCNMDLRMEEQECPACRTSSFPASTIIDSLQSQLEKAQARSEELMVMCGRWRDKYHIANDNMGKAMGDSSRHLAMVGDAEDKAWGWFDAFQEVEKWMLERNLWDEKDITDNNPATTLIKGLQRVLDRLDEEKTVRTNIVSGCLDALIEKPQTDIEKAIAVEILSLRAQSRVEEQGNE